MVWTGGEVMIEIISDHKPTNADKIREMDDEELAELIHNICPFSEYEEPKLSIYLNKEREIGDNIHDIIEWLQQPAE